MRSKRTRHRTEGSNGGSVEREIGVDDMGVDGVGVDDMGTDEEQSDCRRAYQTVMAQYVLLHQPNICMFSSFNIILCRK